MGVNASPQPGVWRAELLCSAVAYDELRTEIRHAVEFNDDDALASVVERLRGMRFIEVRRVLDGLDAHQLRRVAETAISLTGD
jgi:hypothetical protein